MEEIKAKLDLIIRHGREHKKHVLNIRKDLAKVKLIAIIIALIIALINLYIFIKGGN